MSLNRKSLVSIILVVIVGVMISTHLIGRGGYNDENKIENSPPPLKEGITKSVSYNNYPEVISSNNVISDKNIPNCDTNKQHLKVFKTKRASEISIFLKSLLKKNIPWNVVENIAVRAGLGIIEVETFLTSQSFNLKKWNVLSQSTIQEKEYLNKILRDNSFDSLIPIIEGLDQKLFFGLPLYSYMLERSSLPSYEMSNVLLSRGINPTIHDIIISSKLQKNNDNLFDLISNTEITENTFWIENGEIISVSLILTKQYNFQLLGLWLSRTDEQSNLPMISELDYMPFPDSSMVEDAINTIEILLDNGRVVNTHRGFERLVRWLPKKWLSNNSHRLYRPKFVFNEISKNYKDELAIILKDLQYREKQLIERPCNNKGQSIALIKNSDYQQKYISFRNLVSKDKKGFILGELYSIDIGESQNKFIKQLIHSILEKKWDSVLNTLPSIVDSSVNQLALDTSIRNALISNASLKIITELIELGASLPDDSVHLLAELGYTELLVKLLPYGLNVYYENNVGMNAIEHLVYKNAHINYNRDKENMLRLLREYNVSITNNNNLDALNFAIMSLNSSDIAILYCNILLDLGAPIETSHYQQLLELERINQTRYLEVISNIKRFMH